MHFVDTEFPRLQKQVTLAVKACARARPADCARFCATHLLKQSAAAAPPTTTDPAPANTKATSEWTAAAWLASEGVEHVLASALLRGNRSGQLAQLRALGSSASLEEDLVDLLASAIGPLAAALAPRLRALATTEAATSGEVRTKFSQEARGMLECTPAAHPHALCPHLPMGLSVGGSRQMAP